MKTKKEVKKVLDLTSEATTLVTIISGSFNSLMKEVKPLYKTMLSKQLKFDGITSLAKATDDQVNNAKRKVNKVLYVIAETHNIKKDTMKTYCKRIAESLGLAKDKVNTANRKGKGGNNKSDKKTPPDQIEGVILIDTNKENYDKELQTKLTSLLSLMNPHVHIDTVVKALTMAVENTKFNGKIEIKKVA